jgi:hypothetical protein
LELLANDLSIHGQFHDLLAFRDALARLMAMRAAARRFGRDVHCHRQFLMVEALPGVSLQQTLGQLDRSERLAAIGWLTRGGPFWEDLRRHGAGDWLEYRGEVVTDTAVGEAAFRALHGVTSGLLSVTPSDWSFSPVEVTWREPPDNMRDRAVALENWWNAEELERSLQTAEPQISSWANLRHVSTARFASLTFAGDCFEPLSGIPFLPSAADRIRALLQILDRFARAFDASGKRTPNGQRVYQNYFTGDSAPFSDSSDKEKRRFNKELTFHDPNNPGRYLLCPWHGKVADFRIHFSWPVRYGEPVYVVYVGSKITRR